jgi:hypothetical protein
MDMMQQMTFQSQLNCYSVPDIAFEPTTGAAISELPVSSWSMPVLAVRGIQALQLSITSCSAPRRQCTGTSGLKSKK